MGIISVHPDFAKVPFKEFKAYIEKTHPGADAEKLYVEAGGKLPDKKKEGEK
ncbi:MAG TPA: hypothetical protein PLP69_08165 [Bacteroidales bacterium]|nr:hypothetical protein [Bacteroidales bacterium]